MPIEYMGAVEAGDKCDAHIFIALIGHIVIRNNGISVDRSLDFRFTNDTVIPAATQLRPAD